MPSYANVEDGDLVNMDTSPTTGIPLTLSTCNCAMLASVITMVLLKGSIAYHVYCDAVVYLDACANWNTERDDGKTDTVAVLLVILISG